MVYNRNNNFKKEKPQMKSTMLQLQENPNSIKKTIYKHQVKLVKAKKKVRSIRSGKAKTRFRGKTKNFIPICHYCGISRHIRPRYLKLKKE